MARWKGYRSGLQAGHKYAKKGPELGRRQAEALDWARTKALQNAPWYQCQITVPQPFPNPPRCHVASSGRPQSHIAQP
ncbi:hypothetical protein SKAU_G00390080 [Synaphobranchus kaupii]|uniref:Uncharacterized protein n=1 Tax=Synaphobranchus kaupii TaxID=118154 RepID=A0A9Q1EBD8_SYNKA|nr:hypothetical protein SKAU_G00390080 [Synaphobranchus kaupii]